MSLATVPAVTDPRELALLKAVGLDRASPEQRDLALNIASRYELDLLLKHLVLIDGRPYITRDGLLHVAHRDGNLDGIVTTEAVEADGFWRASCSVYRKDMSHPFTYSGRYPVKGKNLQFGPEMAIKVAEVMALRRAFDVAAPVAEERWDTELPVVDTTPKPTLAEVAAAKTADMRAAIKAQQDDVEEPVRVEPVLAEPMTEAESATVDEPGLTVAEFGTRARAAGVTKTAIVGALDVVPLDVTKAVEALTDQDRWRLAESLGLA